MSDTLKSAFEQLYRAICALSIGDIDGEHRSRALEWLQECNGAIVNGLRAREVGATDRQLDPVLRIIVP